MPAGRWGCPRRSGVSRQRLSSVFCLPSRKYEQQEVVSRSREEPVRLGCSYPEGLSGVAWRRLGELPWPEGVPGVLQPAGAGGDLGCPREGHEGRKFPAWPSAQSWGACEPPPLWGQAGRGLLGSHPCRVCVIPRSLVSSQLTHGRFSSRRREPSPPQLLPAPSQVRLSAPLGTMRW